MPSMNETRYIQMAPIEWPKHLPSVGIGVFWKNGAILPIIPSGLVSCFQVNDVDLLAPNLSRHHRQLWTIDHRLNIL